ncbi:MAG: dTDP-4-dehydrorhamnose 3,5-epimerase family protein [Thermomicrobiales bacterium]|nr:dTDP-4-dehydrorhamnose 3,5-epimerase family protein [Thermomicrobiales bacterium]
MTSLRSVQKMVAARAMLGETLVVGADDPSPVAGAILRSLRVNRDPRGTLTELLRADWGDVCGPEMPFAQVYASVTVPGIARDEDRWHVHERQTDRFLCLAGRIVVAVADARPDSPTQGRLLLADMAAASDAPAPYMVAVPPGALHGFVALGETPALLLNLPTRLYDASDERRVEIDGSGVVFPDGTPFSWQAVRAALG